MNRNLSRILAMGALAFAGCATGEIDPAGPQVYTSADNARLSPASRADADAVVRDFLKSHGVGKDALDSLRTSRSTRGNEGRSHILLEQEVGGKRVEGAYVKASLDASGQLIQVIDNAARVKGAAIAQARVDARQALRAALKATHADLSLDPAQVSHQGNLTTFGRGDAFVSDPTVESVAIPGDDGSLGEGYLVETWTHAGNLLYYTLVGGDGAIRDVELRTNSDSYNVFAESPLAGPQTVVPGAPGWLGTGAQSTHAISGNNVRSYLDIDANNSADPGGTAVTDGNFLTIFSDTTTPATDSNRSVAVQNLFYLNNVVHDALYAAGFNEAAGNFQVDNFGKGGRAGDPVNAEAQDGSGTDNANFSTPRDGSSPRMQMYLWTGIGDVRVVVGANDYQAQAAGFGGAFTASGVTGALVLVNDGVAAAGGGTTSDACEPLPAGSLTGKVALADRGLCSFVIKVKNLQDAGASAAVIANNAGATSIFAMGGTDATITIPSAMVGHDDGLALHAQNGASANVHLTTPAPLQRDGDVDSDIVFHEYGHGLSWRMIGRMSGPMAGAIGEGNSDVIAIILNGDDVVGEYSFSDEKGIRSAPYHNFPRTYASVTGSEVHFDGEVYGAIGWRMLELFTAANLPKTTLLGYIVDGMNFTPAQPTYEQMRDGILAATPADRDCLVWRAFAQYGVGVGAKATVRGSTVKVTESFALPAACQ